MKIELRSARRSIAEIKAQLYAVGVVSGQLTEAALELDQKLDGALSRYLRRTKFRGAEGETRYLELEAHPVLLVGLGMKRHLELERVRRLGGLVAREVLRLGFREAAVENFFWEKFGKDEAAYALAEGLYLGSYVFDRYKSEPGAKRVRYWIARGRGRAVEAAVRMAGATAYARDLVNEPPNALTPEALAEAARGLARELGLDVSVLGPEEMEDKGMGALLAVGRGSAHPPRLVHLVYRPEGSARAKVALVGKGMTFDTGGYSLKPRESMVGMKSDMAGAASVLGAMRVVGEARPDVEVHAVIAAAENRISDRAYLVDEVIRTMSGKTVEVKNTDAEGRLVLADALWYAGFEAPDGVISVATLTGAARVALGERIAALYATQPRLLEALREAGAAEGETLWPMPLERAYRKKLISHVADIANVGDRNGGSIQAALFLAEFVRDPYAHLDIAGPAFLKEAWELGPAGATGFATRSLARYLLGL